MITNNEQREDLIDVMGKLGISLENQMTFITIVLAGMEAQKTKDEIMQDVRAFLASCDSASINRR